jgi:5-formyltetrahydrofolate cyclo-ligase
MPDDQNDIPAEYSSPACMLHEIDPAYAGLAPPAPPEGVAAWRKVQREQLIAARLAISAEARVQHSQAIADALDRELGDIAGKAVSLYWPFRGEPDMRPWMERATARGATCLLPVVVQKAKPLIFKSWKQGEKLDRGIWNIPIPAEGTEMRNLIAASGTFRSRPRVPKCRPTSSFRRWSVSIRGTTGLAMAAASSTARWPPVPASRW